MSDQRKDNVEDLYDEVVGELRRKIKEREATAADLSAAIKLLQNAGISADADHPDAATSELQKALAAHDAEMASTSQH